MKNAASFAILLALIACPALADPIVDEKSTTETSITMDENAYPIHTINRRHDIASFYDQRGGKNEMKRYLVETEIDPPDPRGGRRGDRHAKLHPAHQGPAADRHRPGRCGDDDGNDRRRGCGVGALRGRDHVGLLRRAAKP